ncbi:MAG: sigma-70 family RNA polymerase sigma factor [Clostridia bacterium]|nr:sigma-70 family RNA polymerase sigma factor [Clostridia bacterium]
MLSQEEVLFYLRNAKKGDKKAKEILFINNEALLKSIIRRFKNKGIEYEDLYQIASIGLLKAINNFDESFNVKFSTYTVPMVIGEIKRHIRDTGAIKVSRMLKILANKINRFIDEYQLKNNISPSIEIIAKEFDIPEDEVVIAMDSSKIPVSIYDSVDEDEEGLELINKLHTNDTEDNLVEKIELASIIDSLPEREKKLIIMRYFRDNTQGEIAKSLGVSQVQVSRLENKIIDKIRLKI